MTKERLEEIKNNLEMQMTVAKQIGYNKPTTTLQTSIDLYNYVIDLQDKLKKISNFIEFTKKNKFEDEYVDLFIKDMCNSIDEIIKEEE